VQWKGGLGDQGEQKSAEGKGASVAVLGATPSRSRFKLKSDTSKFVQFGNINNAIIYVELFLQPLAANHHASALFFEEILVLHVLPT